MITIITVSILFAYSLMARMFQRDYSRCIQYLPTSATKKPLLNLKSSIWHAYYKFFNIDPKTIRPLGHARTYTHGNKAKKAIILIHGLTDSTFSLTDLSEHFYSIGYDVYLPLLNKHGVKNITSMKGVSLKAWKSNIQFTIDTLSKSYDNLSIGGLSMGALLAFHASQQDERINGKVYLFSAPFELKPRYPGIIGKIQELYVFNIEPRENQALIDTENPYLYSRMDRYGLRELVKLIHEVEPTLFSTFNKTNRFKNRVLAIHSEADKNAYVNTIKKLSCQSSDQSFQSIIIPAEHHVSHGSVVFNKTIYKTNGNIEQHIIEKKNPLFSSMADTISRFDNY